MNSVNKKRFSTLTEQDINDEYNNALQCVKQYIDMFNIRCSTNIIFCGLCDDVISPIRLSYNKHARLFMLFFSKHYLQNNSDKIRKMIVRYIVCTNNDGTFKTYLETREELKKIKDENHYNVTYTNDFIECDMPTKSVTCEKCHRSYRYKDDDPIFQNIANYRCQCGGTLVDTNANHVVPEERIKIYSRKNFGDKKARKIDISIDMFQKTYFQDINPSDEDYLLFSQFVESTPKLTKKNLEIAIEQAMDMSNSTLLQMYEIAFPDLYTKAISNLPSKYKQITIKNKNQEQLTLDGMMEKC